MCGLFGLVDMERSFTGKEKSKMLHILASESEARGTDAAGIAYNLGGQLCIYKRPVPGHKLSIRVGSSTAAVMGHTRMTTQGRPARNRNNHPFFGMAGDTAFALAHNGVLYNDKSLRQSLHLPKTRIETDSYAAVQLIEQKNTLGFDSLQYMAEKVEGSFSFSVLDGEDHLYLVKGDSPLCLCYFPERRLYLYASTEEILKKSTWRIRTDLGRAERIAVDCGDILRLSPDGAIAKGHFYFKAPYSSRFWRPCWWLEPWKKACSASGTYLEEIKAVAPAFGYRPEEIDLLAREGFSPEELEEFLYCGEL